MRVLFCLRGELTDAKAPGALCWQRPCSTCGHCPGRREGAQSGGTTLGPWSLLLLPFHSLIRPHPLLPALCTSLRIPNFPWSPFFPCFSLRPFLWPGSSGRPLSSKQQRMSRPLPSRGWPSGLPARCPPGWPPRLSSGGLCGRVIVRWALAPLGSARADCQSSREDGPFCRVREFGSLISPVVSRLLFRMAGSWCAHPVMALSQ